MTERNYGPNPREYAGERVLRWLGYIIETLLLVVPYVAITRLGPSVFDSYMVGYLAGTWLAVGIVYLSRNHPVAEWLLDHDDPAVDESKSIDGVYRDRNLLACALARTTHAPSGYYLDEESPDKWAIVWIETPQGQVSWHVPRELVDGLSVPRNPIEWDGHSRATKNSRLAHWTSRGCPS